MKPLSTVAERASLFSLRLLAGLHLLFLLAFVAGLLAAAAQL